MAARIAGRALMASCPAFDASGPYVGNVLGMVDCHVLAMAEEGWQALSAQSGFGAGLTGLLVIFVALIGYRLILGERFVLRDGAALALRLGVVLALCTQWAAWNALAFRVGTQGTESLAGAVLAPGGLGGEDRYGLALRLDRVGAAFDEIAKVDAAAIQQARQQQAGQAQAAQVPNQTEQAAQPAQPVTTLNLEQKKDLARALGLLQASALAGLIAVRATIALLLAVGPLFVSSLLFETTRALFAGWIRAVAGAMLAAVAVPMVLALELAVVEPQTGALAAIVGTSQPLGHEVTQIWTSALLFALVLGAVALGVARASSAFRLPDGWRGSVERWAGGQQVAGLLPAPAADGGAALPEGRSRAQRIADAAMVAQRREERDSGETRLVRSIGVARGPLASAERAALTVPLGQAGLQSARRGARRASGQAARRDSRQ
jgi:type IV secretion system protein VirB6